MAKKIKTKVKKLGKSQIPKIVVSKLKKNCWTCEEYKREQLLKQLEIQKETIKALNQISKSLSAEQPQKSSLQPSEKSFPTSNSSAGALVLGSAGVPHVFKAPPRAEIPTNIIQQERPFRKTLPIEKPFPRLIREERGANASGKPLDPVGKSSFIPSEPEPEPILPVLPEFEPSLIIETDNLKELPSMEKQKQPKRLSIPKFREKEIIIETRRLKRTKPVQTPLFEPIEAQEETLGAEMKPKQEKRGRPRLPVEGPINLPSEELLATIRKL